MMVIKSLYEIYGLRWMLACDLRFGTFGIRKLSTDFLIVISNKTKPPRGLYGTKRFEYP
jgi:hypothetical protein